MEKTTLNVKAHTVPFGDTYHLVIQNDFHSVTLTDYTREQIDSLTPEIVVLKVKNYPELSYFKDLVLNDNGLFFNGQWHEITLQPTDSSWCYHCGTTTGRIPFKMYNNKPHCQLCVMALESKRDGKIGRP